MNLIRIRENNFEYAVLLQEELFPQESGRANIMDSLEPSSDYEYYLIFHEGACVGITGIYHYPEDPESAWLGWFGIRAEFRRKNFGSEALKLFEDMAVQRKYRFARLYTDAENNEAAIAFYRTNGYISEPYENAEDPACMQYKTLIFSKPLAGHELILWNSRNIHLTEQISAQNRYSQRQQSVTGSAEPQAG